jgi:23S rRNA pseudouridine2605 synthase
MIKLAKFIAENTEYSRRKAEELIQNGFIYVNNKQETNVATRVSSEDCVKIQDQLIESQKTQDKLFILNKPKGYVVSKSDDKNRQTIYDLLPDNMQNYLYIGRLDLSSEGLLLLTNSGEVCNKLSHPSNNNIRVYIARVRGILTSADIQKIAKGINVIINDKQEKLQADIELLSSQKDKTNLHYKVVLNTGKNREIRRIFDHFGLNISKLRRVQYGKYLLPEDLKLGSYIEVQI